ncbi:MAG: putative glycoside hydrolase [Spirochaetes bacterium]|nr:putative glycoside hydrolase [Spirochaetota bacterium]
MENFYKLIKNSYKLFIISFILIIIIPNLSSNSSESIFFSPFPNSTLLPPQTKNFHFSINTKIKTVCAYSVNELLPFEKMNPFNEKQPSFLHTVTINGINPDPTYINKIYIRTKDNNELLVLNYRCTTNFNHSFPRIGNLWGGWNFESIEEMAKSGIKLWLGLHYEKEDLLKLKKLSPDSIILTSINAIEEADLPEDFYLHSPDGKRVEVWPGSYRLNLTKEKVWKYLAELAYNLILDSDLLYDGIFFDNVMTTQSWLNEDIYYNSFSIDANEDGKPDDPDEFDKKWKEGVINEILYFKKLVPGAIISGHSIDGSIEEFYKVFNGKSFGFYIANVLENQMDFEELISHYQKWESIAKEPQIIMFEGSPNDEIAYGYGYEPQKNMPEATLKFAQSYYKFMRFGLCFTLLGNGYYAYEIGDTYHGNNWLYDEYYSDLGFPENKFYEIPIKDIPYNNIIPEGNFENTDNLGLFRSWVDEANGYKAKLSYEKIGNNTYAKIEVKKGGADSWRIDFGRHRVKLMPGKRYELRFKAFSKSKATINVISIQDKEPWNYYGLNESFELDNNIKSFSFKFKVKNPENKTIINDCRIIFLLGEKENTYYFDDIELFEISDSILARDFSNGIVLLNPNNYEVNIKLNKKFKKLMGNQAPKYQIIIDNIDKNLKILNTWILKTIDSGLWKVSGPFFHDWSDNCYISSKNNATAQFSFIAPEKDNYTIYIWWPIKSHKLFSHCKNVKWQIIVNNNLLVSGTIDQTKYGDQWVKLTKLKLDKNDNVIIQLSKNDSLNTYIIVDALLIESDLRYNDGAIVDYISLFPLDGIILKKY